MTTAPATDSSPALCVRPVLIGRHSLRAQLDLVIETWGERADTAADVIDEWLACFGLPGADAAAVLRAPAGSASPLLRWQIALLQGLLSGADRLQVECPAGSPEHAEVARIVALLQRRYPLREFRLVAP